MTYYATYVAALHRRLYPQQQQLEQVIAARRYIDTHYGGNIDLQAMAQAACMSRFHFIRQFSRLYGMAPHRYLTIVRLAKARQMLATGMGVSEVCYAVGFSSLSSFSGLFRRKNGMSPEQYRRKNSRV